MQPKVSVIFPVFNNEKTVEQAIRSILNQTFTNFELIIINDGSSDKTENILKIFDDRRVKIIGSDVNLGLPRRLNQGIAEARGEYIARMDADDIAFPERFEKQVSYLDNHPETDVLATRAIIFNNDYQLLGLLPFAEHHRQITRRPWNSMPMPHPTWMARRSWYARYQYAIPEVWRAEDQDLLLRGHKNSIYACLPDVLLCYRQGPINYKAIALARRCLLRAQIDYFLKQKNRAYIILSIGVFIFKSLSDIASRLNFVRGVLNHLKTKEPIPNDVYLGAKKILDSV